MPPTFNVALVLTAFPLLPLEWLKFPPPPPPPASTRYVEPIAILELPPFTPSPPPPPTVIVIELFSETEGRLPVITPPPPPPPPRLLPPPPPPPTTVNVTVGEPAGKVNEPFPVNLRIQVVLVDETSVPPVLVGHAPAAIALGAAIFGSATGITCRKETTKKRETKELIARERCNDLAFILDKLQIKRWGSKRRIYTYLLPWKIVPNG